MRHDGLEIMACQAHFLRHSIPGDAQLGMIFLMYNIMFGTPENFDGSVAKQPPQFR